MWDIVSRRNKAGQKEEVRPNGRTSGFTLDGSQLTLSDRVVVDNPNGHTTLEGATTLEQGWRGITVHFLDRTGGTQIYLHWTPTGVSTRQLVPLRCLSPPMGRYSVADQSFPEATVDR
jgi:hypothetical protein